MKLKLSCTDFSFPVLTHDQALGVISLIGLPGVDIGLFEGHGHLKPSCELIHPTVSGAQLKRRLKDRGLMAADIFLQIHADFSEYALNHPKDARRIFARDQFLRAIEYANAAGSNHLTILPGMAFKGESREASLARSVKELRWRVSQARGAKLCLGVEPHVGSIVDTPERALELAKRVPGLGLTLDYAHFTRAGFPDSAIEPLAKYATHLHARSARTGRLQAPLKENTIDFARIIRVLAARKFFGFIALEYVWIDWEHCNEVDILSETMQLQKALKTAAARIV
jgi:sugar phosphate isomerase/epimerase